jgi:excisionase family DNA binding protein
MAATPILVTRKTAAQMLSISVGMVSKLVRQGKLEPVRLGKRVMFNRASIEELALPPSRRRSLRDLDPTLPLQ